MEKYNIGEVWWIHFPYSDKDQINELCDKFQEEHQCHQGKTENYKGYLLLFSAIP